MPEDRPPTKMAGIVFLVLALLFVLAGVGVFWMAEVNREISHSIERIFRPWAKPPEVTVPILSITFGILSFVCWLFGIVCLLRARRVRRERKGGLA